MTPEERERLVEEAIARIEPLDEPHRARLARMRDRLRELGDEATREVAKIRAESDPTRAGWKVDSEALRRELAEHADRTRVFQDAFASAFAEQADLIHRIVGVV